MAKSPKVTTSFEPYPAPGFELPTAEGTNVNLRDLKGQWIILFFYPKDDTPGCTQEACDFSEHLNEFNRLGATLFGISKDSLKSHSRFITKYGLKMPLLSDEETDTINAYGAWVEKTLYGRKYLGTDRSTFIIDPEGLVRHEWRAVKVKGHVEEVLERFKSLKD